MIYSLLPGMPPSSASPLSLQVFRQLLPPRRRRNRSCSPDNAFGSYLAARHAGAERDSGRRRGLLPQCAQARSAKYRSAQPRFSFRAHRRRYRRARASSPTRCSRSITADRISRLVDRHPRTQAETLRTGSAGFCAVGARSGDRPDGDDVGGVGAVRRRRCQRGHRHHGQAFGPGLVRHLQGSACRADPRSRQEQQRRPASDSPAPTRPIRRLCVRWKPMAGCCRATAARTMR